MKITVNLFKNKDIEDITLHHFKLSKSGLTLEAVVMREVNGVKVNYETKRYKVDYLANKVWIKVNGKNYQIGTYKEV